MVERRPALTVLTHLVLILGVLIVAFPVYVTFVASTHTAQAIVQAPMPLVPGNQMLQNYTAVLIGTDAGAGSAAPVGRMMFVSLVSALTIALGKIAISLLSAFAIVYFRFPFRNFFFWAIFVTLMLPVEVRIGPTYEVVSDLGMLNSYAGLTVPLIASATATFLFRQFFLTVPDELAEAARIGCRELWFVDENFADWPLGERDVVELLTQWAQGHRTLTLLARHYDEVVRRHARWTQWRVQWSHVVECRSFEEAAEGEIPTVLLALDRVGVRLFDPLRYRGSCSREAAELVRQREVVDAVLQRSMAAFPASTLGL